MSPQLLVLLLALVVKDEYLLPATFAKNFAGHQSVLRSRNLAAAAGNSQHVAKLHSTVLSALRFQAKHISGRNPILLSTCANDRVHSFASMPRRGAGLCSNFPQR